MRFERSRWFQCVFRDGLVSGWPVPLRAVARLAMLVTDVGLFMLFASHVRAAPVCAPLVALFAIRALYSAGRVLWPDTGGDALAIAIVESVRAEAEGREP